MKAGYFLGLTLASCLGATKAHVGHQVSPGMQKVMNVIRQNCAIDVHLLCEVPDEIGLVGPRIFRLGAPRDPILELMMNPLAPPPRLLEVTSILDDMMYKAMSLERDQSSPLIHVAAIHNIVPEEKSHEPITMIVSEEESHQPPGPELFLDSMIHTLIERSNEKPEVVADKIIEHGNNLLKTEKNEDLVRMARRLTQVDPKSVSQTRLPLPFSCAQNRCLMQAFEQGAVSVPCAESLRTAEETSYMVARKVARVENESRAFLSFTIIYLVLAFVTLFALRRHLRKLGRQLNPRLQLSRKIFQAVYSNPELKAKVEDAIGYEIGLVPPLPPHILAEMGGKTTKVPFIKKLLKVVAFATILTLVFVDPVLAMFSLCLLMFARFLHLFFCPPQPLKQSCSCCCCGASTEDVENGKLTEDQACCTCCKGTGVCGSGCSACCTDDSSCDCCSDDCSCCDDNSCSESSSPVVRRVNEEIYHGIPIKVV